MDIEKNGVEFGKRLKTARKINNLTLEEVANQIGSTKSALSRYESGDRSPGHEVLIKLASTYKISLDFLVNGSLYTFPEPGHLLIDFETGRNKEISKEEFEVSRKLLIEKVKQVISKEIEKLEHTALIEFLDLDYEHLRGISRLVRNDSLKYSIKHLNHIPIEDLDKLADYIDKWG